MCEEKDVLSFKVVVYLPRQLSYTLPHGTATTVANAAADAASTTSKTTTTTSTPGTRQVRQPGDYTLYKILIQ